MENVYGILFFLKFGNHRKWKVWVTQSISRKKLQIVKIFKIGATTFSTSFYWGLIGCGYIWYFLKKLTSNSKCCSHRKINNHKNVTLSSILFANCQSPCALSFLTQFQSKFSLHLWVYCDTYYFIEKHKCIK